MEYVSMLRDAMQERRSTSGIFAGKYGLITLRDLFRWAERYKKSEVREKFHDWNQQLAEDGECRGLPLIWSPVKVS